MFIVVREIHPADRDVRHAQPVAGVTASGHPPLVFLTLMAFADLVGAHRQKGQQPS
jgi:hypothetical protein